MILLRLRQPEIFEISRQNAMVWIFFSQTSDRLKSGNRGNLQNPSLRHNTPPRGRATPWAPRPRGPAASWPRGPAIALYRYISAPRPRGTAAAPRSRGPAAPRPLPRKTVKIGLSRNIFRRFRVQFVIFCMHTRKFFFKVDSGTHLEHDLKFHLQTSFFVTFLQN